jgi:hypothetical protein
MSWISGMGDPLGVRTVIMIFATVG